MLTKTSLYWLILIKLILSSFSDLPAQDRRWIGPDFLAMPIHDWRIEAGRIVVEPGKFNERQGPYGMGSRLHLTTKKIEHFGVARMRFNLKREHPGTPEGKAGLWLGLTSRTPSPQNVFVHPNPERAIFIGLNDRGQLQVDSLIQDLDTHQELSIHLEVEIRENRSLLTVNTRPASGTNKKLEVSLETNRVMGYLCLSATGKGSRWSFSHFDITGNSIEIDPKDATGPIVWTQYTTSNGVTEVQAQMVPTQYQSTTSSGCLFDKGSTAHSCLYNSHISNLMGLAIGG